MGERRRANEDELAHKSSTVQKCLQNIQMAGFMKMLSGEGQGSLIQRSNMAAGTRIQCEFRGEKAVVSNGTVGVFVMEA
eukprot:evm.model.NODE_32570_length_4749_cov_41.536743.1